MRFVFLAIVLAFPILDLLLTVRFARWSGVPVWAWLGMSVLGGLLLLRNERVAFRDNIVASKHGDQPLLRGLGAAAAGPTVRRSSIDGEYRRLD